TPFRQTICTTAYKDKPLVFDKFVMNGLNIGLTAGKTGSIDKLSDLTEVLRFAVALQNQESFVTDTAGLHIGPTDQTYFIEDTLTDILRQVERSSESFRL